MSSPTKADLTAAVARLTEEVAALRDLLAAVSLAADTVPVAKTGDELAEWKRSCHVLVNIKILSRLDGGWDGEIAYGAEELRKIAAESVGYEAYVRPPSDNACRLTAKGEAVAAAEEATPAEAPRKTWGDIFRENPAHPASDARLADHAEAAPAQAEAPQCPDERVTPGNPLLRCDLAAGHDPARHEVHSPSGELLVAWDADGEQVDGAWGPVAAPARDGQDEAVAGAA